MASSSEDDQLDTNGQPVIPTFVRVDVGRSRGKSYYKCDDEDHSFKRDIYGTYLSEDSTLSQPFGTEEEMELATADRFEDFSWLFQQGMEDLPEDWYSIFYEVMHDQRLKTSQDDAEDRQKRITEGFKTDMIRFVFQLASTPPDKLGDVYNAESNAVKQSDVAHPWLAANKLIGSLWRELSSSSTRPDPSDDDDPGFKGPDDDDDDGELKKPEVDPTDPSEEKPDAGEPDIQGQGKDPEIPPEEDPDPSEENPEEDPDPTPEYTEEELQLQNEVLAVVTAETDAQREAGLSVAARTDYLLQSFEQATGFMKRMNACELWSITKGVPLLDLMIPWSQDELKTWDHKNGLPGVPDLDKSRTDNPDTARMKVLWDKRDRTRCHVDPSMQVAASFTPTCTYSHFLKLLCDGRQMYSDFAHLYPLLSKEDVKKFLCREFQSVESTKIAKVWKLHNDKMFNRLRSAASRKKKEAADAEAKANAEETKKIEEQRVALAKELEELKEKNDQNREEIGATRRGRKRTEEEIAIAKQIQELSNEGRKKRQCVLANNKEAKQAEADAEAAAKLVAEQEALEKDVLDESTIKKTKKKKKIGTFTLIDLTGDDDVKAPTRDQTQKNKTAYVPPPLPWIKEARHLATLWFQLHFYLDECALREEIDVNYEREVDAERVRNERENATASSIQQAVTKLVEKKKKLTPEAMKGLLRKHTVEDASYKEELMLNPFVRRAILRLGLVDLNEFREEGNLHPKLIKAKAKNIVSSLKSWMHHGSERHMLYRVLRIVEHQQNDKSQLKDLKRLIKKEDFNCQEKDLIVKMVDMITKNNGVEKKKFHDKKKKTSAA